KPQFKRAETASQGNLPVAVVDHSTRFGGLIAQVFRQHRKCLNQVLAIGHIKTVTIEVREHPLMRIEAVAVGEFHAVMEEAELRTESGGAAHGGIDVQPE